MNKNICKFKTSCTCTCIITPETLKYILYIALGTFYMLRCQELRKLHQQPRKFSLLLHHIGHLYYISKVIYESEMLTWEFPGQGYISNLRNIYPILILTGWTKGGKEEQRTLSDNKYREINYTFFIILCRPGHEYLYLILAISEVWMRIGFIYLLFFF